MKKLLFISLAVLLLISLTGCGDKTTIIYSGTSRNTNTINTNEPDYSVNGMFTNNAFTKAFNMAIDGGTIDINSGTYTISTPVISGAKNLLIEGDDINKPTIIKCDAIAFIMGNDNWIFRNLTIITDESCGIGISTLNNKNCFLQNVTINGILYNGDYHIGDLPLTHHHT